MEPVNCFSYRLTAEPLALCAPKSVVAQNIANSDTPGYKAMDVEPFEAILNETGMAMKRTQANHLTPPERRRHRCRDGRKGRLGRTAFGQQRHS